MYFLFVVVRGPRELLPYLCRGKAKKTLEKKKTNAGRAGDTFVNKIDVNYNRFHCTI